MKIPNQTFLFDSSICTDFLFYAFCIFLSLPFYTCFFCCIFPPTPMCVYSNQTMVWHANIDTFLYSTCTSTKLFAFSYFPLVIVYVQEAFMFTPTQRYGFDYVLKKHFLFTVRDSFPSHIYSLMGHFFFLLFLILFGNGAFSECCRHAHNDKSDCCWMRKRK